LNFEQMANYLRFEVSDGAFPAAKWQGLSDVERAAVETKIENFIKEELVINKKSLEAKEEVRYDLLLKDQTMIYRKPDCELRDTACL